jgi:multiple sugar transport system ATP-binding protein
MRTELQRLQEDLGTTTVYVTHDQTEAMTMGDRIAILDGGELQQVATPLEAYHRPANRFVAGFIGEPSMNFFRMEVQGDRLVHAPTGGEGKFAYPLSADVREAVADSARVELGIRPEDIELVDEATGGHDFETVVDVVEPMGNENNVYLTFSADDDETFVATVGGLQRLDGGQPVAARIPESAIHVFDSETGAALHNRSLEETEEPEAYL